MGAKEGLRSVFHARTLDQALSRLDAWQRWASRSRLDPFVRLARSVRDARPRIVATLTHGLTNAILEARNTQIRLLTRLAHGFHRVEALIGLAMLKLAGLCPPLPGRAAPTTPAGRHPLRRHERPKKGGAPGGAGGRSRRGGRGGRCAQWLGSLA